MKRILIILVLLCMLAASWYAYHLYTGPVKSLTTVKADVRISAADLIATFEKDSALANKMYLGKVLEINGRIKSVENESPTIILGNDNRLSSVRCSMDTAFVKVLSTLNPGNFITIKGNCTGYNADELGIGSDVVLNRCVLESGKNK